MKKSVLLFATVFILVLGLVGCDTYTSHYSAVMYAHNNDSDSAWMSFGKFTGTEVFKFRCPDGKTAKIQYSGKLESGSLTVYYDCGNAKTELFRMQAGDEISAESEPLGAGLIYVILETNETCENGSISFELIYD